MTTAIKFDNVSIVFGDKPELALPLMDQGLDRNSIQEQTDQVMGVHDCSFEVQQGEIFVLMGLSGSGKSTLLRAANGLNPVARGAVHVEDDGGSTINVTAASPRELRHIRSDRIAMVFQQFGLLPWRTVVENVALGLELSGVPKRQRKEKAIEQLALVGLEDWADSQVSELSGGMQQRVGLARAFATDAPILLMDEPFSALDPLIRSRLQDELLDLQEKLQRTILFVSHDLDEAFKLGNRIAILEGGHISQIGTPREIFSRPADRYVADFVAHMNPLAILRASDAMNKPLSDTYVETVPAETLLADMLDTLANAKGPIGVLKQGELVGQLTSTKVLRFLAGHLGDEGEHSGN